MVNGTLKCDHIKRQILLTCDYIMRRLLKLDFFKCLSNVREILEHHFWGSPSIFFIEHLTYFKALTGFGENMFLARNT